MSTAKGRILDLKARMESKASPERAGPEVILRANELYRLLSLINKVRWGRELSAEDERDGREIESIEQGDCAMLHPEQRFFPPACTRYDQEGVLCWFQDQRQGPLRPLTPEETALWRRVGPTALHGYLRLDGSIYAYLLSGTDESSIPPAYPE